MKVIIAAGKDFRLNDLTVVAAEDVVIDLVTATTEDQAAGLCAAHGIPADMSQFVHQEEDVQVSYNNFGERVETRLETKANEEEAAAAPAEEAAEVVPPLDADPSELPIVPAEPVVGDAPQEPALPPIPTPSESAEGSEGSEGSENAESGESSEPAGDGEPEAPATEEAAA